MEIAVLCNLEKVKIVEVWFSMPFAVFKEYGTERGRSCHWCGDCPTYMNHFGTSGSALGFETSSNIVRILSCKLIKVQLIEDNCAAALCWSLASNLHFDPDPSMNIDVGTRGCCSLGDRAAFSGGEIHPSIGAAVQPMGCSVCLGDVILWKQTTFEWTMNNSDISCWRLVVLWIIQ